jgi:hypothetical protein
MAHRQYEMKVMSTDYKVNSALYELLLIPREFLEQTFPEDGCLLCCWRGVVW